MDNYGIGVPMNVRCEGTIVLYHKNSIRGNRVGVFHTVCNLWSRNRVLEKTDLKIADVTTTTY